MRDLVEVFEETQDLSITTYKEDTDKLKENTIIYKEPYNLDVEPKYEKSKIQLSAVGTVAAAALSDLSVAVLNFADPFVPGGLVLQGATTQEEGICRCSNLYESLTLPECMEDYYDYNYDLYDRRFSHRIIYSKDVAFFRDDSSYHILSYKYYADVITCPCPIDPCPDDYIEERMLGIFKSAAVHDVKHLVLGLWGCGAFKNDPIQIGRCFGHTIRNHPCFELITFALKSDPTVVPSSTSTSKVARFKYGLRLGLGTDYIESIR